LLYGGGKSAFADTAFPVTKNGITYGLYLTEAFSSLQGCVSVRGFVPDELVNVITAKRKAVDFKNEMCFSITKTKSEIKKHPNS